LERRLLETLHDDSESEEDRAARFRELVVAYHCNWESPVGTGRLSAKVLLELGFLPLVGIIALLTYLYLKVGDVAVEYKNVLMAVVGVLGLADLFVFRYASEYLRRVRPDREAKF
jgi:hypothetical protein